MTDTPVEAAVYVRQSKGSTRSIERQEGDGREACESGGWHVHGVYTDTTSASRYSRQGRPDWDRLLADLDAGAFGVLVMWESSRGDREAETWLGLLRRCREQRVLIHVTSHGRTYDMRKRRDWRTLAEDGVDAEDESNRLSDRIRADVTANAAKGRPHGPVIYGYVRDYDPRTGELTGQRPDLATAPVVREIVSRLGAGEPVTVVTADLNRRGVPAPKGVIWYRSHVRKLALSRAYLGKRQHNGQEYDAIWPAIVTEKDHYAAVRRLTAAGRTTTPKRPGRHKYLLAWLAVCGECGSPLKGGTGRNARRLPLYACPKGCTDAPMEEMDFHVSFYVRDRLYRPDWREFIALQHNDDAAAVRDLAEADRLEHEVRQLAAKLGSGGVTAETVAVAEAAVRPKIDAARRRAAAAAGSVPDPDDILAMWETMGLHQRRQVISLVCERVALHKAAKRGRQKFDGTRVEFVWRDRPGKPYRVPAPIRAKMDFHEWHRLMSEHGGRPSFVISGEDYPLTEDQLAARIAAGDGPPAE